MFSRFIEQEDWEGNNSNNVATEDDDEVDAEVGEYACNLFEVMLRRL
jgi:hypothetical protein